MEKNTKVIVDPYHPHHSDRVGYFRFLGGPKHDIVVLSEKPHESEDELMTLFCVRKEDCEEYNTSNDFHKYESVEKCVHTEHCCAEHGCKYNDDDCPVWLGYKRQSYPYCDVFDKPNNTIPTIPHSVFMSRRKNLA